MMKRRINPKHAIQPKPKTGHAKPRKTRRFPWRSILVAIIALVVMASFSFLPRTANPSKGKFTIMLDTQSSVITPVLPSQIPASEAAWIGSFLWWIKAPDNNNTVETMASWIGREDPWNASPPDGAMFTWNPLNTTLAGFGSTSVVNSVGVRIYPNMADGIQATVSTIEEPQYAVILQNLRWSIGLCGLPYSELSVWSGNGYSQVC